MVHNTPDIAEKWDHPIPLHEDDALYKLLQVVSRENKRIDMDLEELYDDRFLGSATGNELEKLGDYVGARRKNAEGDDKLRKRIRGEFSAQASDGTYSSVTATMLSILEADKSEVSISTPPDSSPKEIDVEVQGVLLDDNPLSKTELADLLDKSVSADATINLIETGTFAFAGDDSTLEGWDEGTWSSTID